MTYKVLGQAVGSGALANLYKPAAGRQAVTSTLVLLNRGATAAPYRVTVAPADGADTAAHTVYEDVLSPGDRLAVQEGWTLGPGDAVRINAPAGVVAGLFGSESAT